MTFNEIFRNTTMFDGENDSLKYETYRQAYQIWKAAQKVVIDLVAENTYYDCNTGQQCFNNNFDLEDIQENLK